MEMTWSNTMGKGPYRGPWMFETTAREMMLDIVAREIGMDPAELRRRNILRAEDLPFTSPGMKEFQEITPGETLDQALEMLDYEAFRREQEAARGRGPLSRCRHRLLRRAHHDGLPGRHVRGGHGPGREERTGDRLPVHQLPRPERRDDDGAVGRPTSSAWPTTTSPSSRATPAPRPYGAGTGGSRTATLAGGAAHAATSVVRDKVVAIAAHLMEAAPEDLELAEGQVSVRGTPAKALSLKDIAAQAYMNPEALPSSSVPVSRRPSGTGPIGSPPGPTPPTSAWSKSTRGRGNRPCCATSSARTAAG